RPAPAPVAAAAAQHTTTLRGSEVPAVPGHVGGGPGVLAGRFRYRRPGRAAAAGPPRAGGDGAGHAGEGLTARAFTAAGVRGPVRARRGRPDGGAARRGAERGRRPDR